MKTKTRVAKLRRKILDIHEEIAQIQAACQHKDFTQISKCIDGDYYNPTDEFYYEFTCIDCGKWWRREQNEYNTEQRAIRAATKGKK